jgi:hypothetical protein
MSLLTETAKGLTVFVPGDAQHERFRSDLDHRAVEFLLREFDA